MKNIFIVILLAVIGILGYMQFKPKEIIAPVVSDTTNVSEETKTKPEQTNTNDTSKAFKTYTNTQYGFSFDYPSTWKLTEDKIKNEVTINTNDIGGINPENRNNPEYPSWSVTFKATDKTFFTQQRISTKVGIITYDETLKALAVDDNGDLPGGNICLPASPLLGINKSIKAIGYGGSLMSDPAYSVYAILTTNGQIIIVSETMAAELTTNLADHLSKIVNSLKLLNGNTVYVPTCIR